MLPSNALQVFRTPELLFPILQFLDAPSNASNATVCRLWSDVALDLLWREVDSLHALFSILAPLIRSSGYVLDFSRKLHFRDWERFDRYRYRVKSLCYCSYLDVSFHQTAFGEIARTRTSLSVLPNIQTLDWDGPLDSCIVFMHPHINSFSITLPTAHRGTGLFLDDVGARMQNLMHLELRLGFMINAIEPNVIKLLSELTKLRGLKIPRHCFTSKIARAASHNPTLEAIEFSAGKRHQSLRPLLDEFNPLLQEGAYQSLIRLELSKSFHIAAAFLDAPFSPKNLTTLHVDCSPIFELPEPFLDLTTAISLNCQQLSSLKLTSHIDSEKLTDEPHHWRDGGSDQITIHHILPLLHLNLMEFYISHHYALQLYNTDVEKIAKSWPNLKYLKLNHEPFYTDEPELTLEALLPFARHCPQLQSVGLFMNEIVPELHSAAGHITYPRFRSLRDLLVGASMIDDEAAVTSFLGRICPQWCDLAEIGVSWDIEYCDPDVMDELDYRRKKWEVVKKWLPVVLDSHREEAERVTEGFRESNS